MAISGPPRSKPKKYTVIAIVRPSAIATKASLRSTLVQSLYLTSPVTRERTINAAACEPALPPAPTSRGIKNTKPILAAMVSSKKAKPAPESSAPKTSRTNQPTRLRYNS